MNNVCSLDAQRGIATHVDLPDLLNEEFALVVFNPSRADIDGPVDLELWFDQKTKNLFAEFFNYESKDGFRPYVTDGWEIPYVYVSYVPRRLRYHRAPRKAPRGQECIVVTVTAPLKVPAWGYTTITCKPEARATRHPDRGILAGDRGLENEHLRVEVNPNGSLRLTDKRSGQTYDRLLVFEERADIGDGWFHGIAVNDRIHSSTAAAADVAVIAAGAQKATLTRCCPLRRDPASQWSEFRRRPYHETFRNQQRDPDHDRFCRHAAFQAAAIRSLDAG